MSDMGNIYQDEPAYPSTRAANTAEMQIAYRRLLHNPADYEANEAPPLQVGTTVNNATMRAMKGMLA